MKIGEMPHETRGLVAASRRVEVAAATREQGLAATRATSRLVKALFDAGWPLSAIAEAMGVTVRTAARRLRAAQTDLYPVPLAPLPPGPARRPVPTESTLDCAGFTARDAAARLGVHPHTLAGWRRAGLFPNTQQTPNGRYLYDYGDLTAVADLRGGGVTLRHGSVAAHGDPAIGRAHTGRFPGRRNLDE